jgi:Flp pilus assembly secretin CpaC
MKKTAGNIFLNLALLTFFIASANAGNTIKKLEIKEGAVELTKVPGLKLFLVKDDKIVGAKTTENANEILLLGKVFGKTQILCWDGNGNQTTLDMTVTPRYWETLQQILEDYPQIDRQIKGEHIVLSGHVRSSEALEKINLAKNLDPTRIINNVTLSLDTLSQKINAYLKEATYKDVKVKVVDGTIFILGEVSDKQRQEQLLSIIKSYATPYKCELNTSGLIINALSKLTVHIQFLELDIKNDRDVGVTMKPHMFWSTDVGTISDALTGSVGGLKKDWKKIGISGYINTLKKNHAAKTIYETTLSTNSGEKAKFQQGGTIHKTVYSEYTTGIHEIPYGFLVDTVPKIVSQNVIETEIKMEMSVPVSGLTKEDEGSLNIRKYSTSSKYNIPPGESIVLSGLNHILDGKTKDALPFLTYIPSSANTWATR